MRLPPAGLKLRQAQHFPIAAGHADPPLVGPDHPCREQQWSSSPVSWAAKSFMGCPEMTSVEAQGQGIRPRI